MEGCKDGVIEGCRDAGKQEKMVRPRIMKNSIHLIGVILYPSILASFHP
jgi:hypothetical protein